MLLQALTAGVLAASTPAAGTETLTYAPPPPWARSVAIPMDMVSGGGAIDVLLFNEQDRFTPEEHATFSESAIRINTAAGLSTVGNLIHTWDPLTERIVIHRLSVQRAGNRIDLLERQKFAILRREQGLEEAMLDGRLTATLQPEELQVGDIVDAAYTLTRRDPVLAHHTQGVLSTVHTGPIGLLRISAAWPSHEDFRTWRSDDLPAVTRTDRDGFTEVGFEQKGAVTPDAPKGAPTAYQVRGALAVTNFKGWSDVSATMYPLYEQAGRLAADSPLKTQAASIAAAASDPKARALAALQLVEDQVRYLYSGLEAGGYTPAAADLTWRRRFGDCKGKTVVLLALLRELGVESAPALVSTQGGDGLDRRIAIPGAFDHVIVRAVIGHREYWLDPTRQGDGSLDAMLVPPYVWALPLRSAGADLEALVPEPLTAPKTEILTRIDARGGVDRPVAVKRIMTIRGDAALGLHTALARVSRDDEDKILKQMLASSESWVQPGKVAHSYDPKAMVLQLTMEGAGEMPFTSPSGPGSAGGSWLVSDSYLGHTPDLTRTSAFRKDAPYAVDYPAFGKVEVQVDLPAGGKEFKVIGGAPVTRTIGAVSYARSTALDNGRFVMIATSRSLASSFPASEARAVEVGLVNLSSYPVSVAYAPAVAALKAKVAPTPDRTAVASPSTAADRASIAYGSKDYGLAEQQFSLAIQSSPSAQLFYNRAAARLAQGKEALAQQDLDASLRLDPRHVYALLGRGRLLLRKGDLAAATRDFDKAQVGSPKPAATATTIATAYEEQGHQKESAFFWEVTGGASSEPTAKARAFANACSARARTGEDLPRGATDCADALRFEPGSIAAVDSRGLLRLRMGDFPGAAADYDVVLEKRPTSASALFGRALARKRMGLGSAADADAAAARRLDPNVEEDYVKWGLVL